MRGRRGKRLRPIFLKRRRAPHSSSPGPRWLSAFLGFRVLCLARGSRSDAVGCFPHNGTVRCGIAAIAHRPLCAPIAHQSRPFATVCIRVPSIHQATIGAAVGALVGSATSWHSLGNRIPRPPPRSPVSSERQHRLTARVIGDGLATEGRRSLPVGGCCCLRCARLPYIGQVSVNGAHLTPKIALLGRSSDACNVAVFVTL